MFGMLNYVLSVPPKTNRPICVVGECGGEKFVQK